MEKPVVSGGAVVSRVLLVGQAPGDKEPVLGRPFAWTAGKKLFRWFLEHTGVDEPTFRSHVYMAAVCRCFRARRPLEAIVFPTDLKLRIALTGSRPRCTCCDRNWSSQ